MLNQFKSAFAVLILMTLLTGIAYPIAVTIFAQVIFPSSANGSMITSNSQVVGSRLIGQPFDDPRYFWSRPSATAPFPYNAMASTGSNYGPVNPQLTQAVESRINALRKADPSNTQPVPIDLVASSASGLDPDISIAAAEYQVPRVAEARGLSISQVQTLVNTFKEGLELGVFGAPRVNVLLLNLALDEMSSK